MLCNGANFASLRNGYWIGKQHKGDSEYVAGYMPYFQSAGNFSGITLPNDNYSNSDLVVHSIVKESFVEAVKMDMPGYTLSKCVKCQWV